MAKKTKKRSKKTGKKRTKKTGKKRASKRTGKKRASKRKKAPCPPGVPDRMCGSSKKRSKKRSKKTSTKGKVRNITCDAIIRASKKQAAWGCKGMVRTGCGGGGKVIV